MTKLLYGEENYLINLNLKKFSQSFDARPMIFDEVDDLEKIIMELTTVSMFSGSKNIIIKNHPIIKDAKKADQFLEEVGNAIKESNIILILDSNKLPKNRLIDYVKDNGDIHEYKMLSSKDMLATIKDIVTTNGGSITNGAATRLSTKLPNNLWIIINEIKKLLIESKNITDEMIEKSIGDYFVDEYFALTNAIISGDKRTLVASYKDKIKNGIQSTFIISQVAATLQLAKAVGSLRNIGMTNKEIATELKIHEFRVKKSLELINTSGEEKNNELILALAKLDKDIKTGKSNDKFGLDKYILNIIR